MSSTLAGKNCFEQTLDAFDRGGGVDTLAVRTVSESHVSSYGIVACGEIGKGDEKGIRKVAKIAEKPSSSFAAANLVTPGLKENLFFSVFGIYVLKPHIFSIIKTMINTNCRSSGGTFSLTEALMQSQKHHEINAVQVEGKRYDLTNPARYAAAVAHFAGN
jgi:UTP-glucose-1-phosphate uridylyltransferase